MTARKRKDLRMEKSSEMAFESEVSDVYDNSKEEGFAHGNIF